MPTERRPLGDGFLEAPGVFALRGSCAKSQGWVRSRFRAQSVGPVRKKLSSMRQSRAKRGGDARAVRSVCGAVLIFWLLLTVAM